jgi:hypothetical protein
MSKQGRRKSVRTGFDGEIFDFAFLLIGAVVVVIVIAYWLLS